MKKSLLLLAVVVTAPIFASDSQVIWSGQSPIALTGEARLHIPAQFFQKNDKLVLVKASGTTQELDNSEKQANVQAYVQPVTSADGTMIAFARLTQPWQVKTVETQPGQGTVVIGRRKLNGKPAWQVKEPAAGRLELYLMPADGGQKKPVFTLALKQSSKDAAVTSLCFSPDGKRLCCVLDNGSDSGLHIVDLAASAPNTVPLANLGIAKAVPLNANRIAVATQNSVAVFDTASRKVTTELGTYPKDAWITQLVVSPDGTTLAYSVAGHGITNGIYTLKLDGAAKPVLVAKCAETDELTPAGFKDVHALVASFVENTSKRTIRTVQIDSTRLNAPKEYKTLGDFSKALNQP